jgi:hypothetical protein
MMTLIEAAKKDIGKKERRSNLGFEDPELEKAMKAVGWRPGWAWCASILEKWIWEAYPRMKEEVQGYFVPSAVATFRNLKNAGYEVSMTPTEGALVFWQRMQDGVAQWQGHAGVVSKVLSDIEFYSIEGNTNSAGSREGDSVQEKRRTVNLEITDGLRVMGFVSLGYENKREI